MRSEKLQRGNLIGLLERTPLGAATGAALFLLERRLTEAMRVHGGVFGPASHLSGVSSNGHSASPSRRVVSQRATSASWSAEAIGSARKAANEALKASNHSSLDSSMDAALQIDRTAFNLLLNLISCSVLLPVGFSWVPPGCSIAETGTSSAGSPSPRPTPINRAASTPAPIPLITAGVHRPARSDQAVRPPAAPLHLEAGLHHGRCIAVRHDPEVAALFADSDRFLAADQFDLQLKGFDEEEFKVWRVTGETAL